MSRPYAYMRKSSVRDFAKDISPETQEREVRTLAARHGDNGGALVMLSDWDISGRAKYTKKRTSYLQLVEAIESGDCSAVYSYSLSRLGRSSTELAKLFDLCKDHGVPIRLVADVIDTSTASGRMMAGMLAQIAQFEADVASERVLAMYATKRERAVKEGRDPRDAVRTSKRYGEADGEDTDLVLRVFRETGSYSQTARRLNEMGVKPRSSETWWASSVGVVVERLDPEIASRTKTRGHPKGGTNFALAKLLRCPLDGAMLTGGHIPLPKGGTVTRYACRHAEAVPHLRVSIAEHLILPAIEAEAAHYYDPDETTGPDVRASRRADLEARRQRIVESRLDGLITRADAGREAAEIDTELARLDTRPTRDLRTVAGMTPKEINAILQSLFERIDLDPATFQPVRFVWRDPKTRRED
jgi:DNA invertase Pin-like site-specific DNA recombinase